MTTPHSIRVLKGYKVNFTRNFPLHPPSVVAMMSPVIPTPTSVPSGHPPPRVLPVPPTPFVPTQTSRADTRTGEEIDSHISCIEYKMAEVLQDVSGIVQALVEHSILGEMKLVRDHGREQENTK